MILQRNEYGLLYETLTTSMKLEFKFNSDSTFYVIRVDHKCE